jgi:hypothetical protein
MTLVQILKAVLLGTFVFFALLVLGSVKFFGLEEVVLAFLSGASLTVRELL